MDNMLHRQSQGSKNREKWKKRFDIVRCLSRYDLIPAFKALLLDNRFLSHRSHSSPLVIPEILKRNCYLPPFIFVRASRQQILRDYTFPKYYSHRVVTLVTKLQTVRIIATYTYKSKSCISPN